MTWAYYNEFDPGKAQWLRELMADGLIALGHVDERSIRDVRPEDLDGFIQCHWFAGIGAWSYALRLSGWPDDRSVWSGSPPCQPFSAAGKRKGTEDDRHLWPELHRLVAARSPDRLYMEQVASRDGLAWLDAVLSDLERAGHTARAFDMCSAGIGAPHIRQRLWIVADANGRHSGAERQQRGGQHGLVTPDSGSSLMAHADKKHDDGKRNTGSGRRIESTDRSDDGLVGDSLGPGPQGLAGHGHNWAGWEDQAGSVTAPGPVNGFWSGADWIACTDGKQRPIKSSPAEMAHGPAAAVVPSGAEGGHSFEEEAEENHPLIKGGRARVLRLRGYGDAINAELAAEFIMATDAAIAEMAAPDAGWSLAGVGQP
jgi:DNA (cytosine-5)-methyltransferase 1